jgi:two-component system sensor histidine kinase/response regulator
MSESSLKGIAKANKGRALALFLFIAMAAATVGLWRASATFIDRAIGERFRMGAAGVRQNVVLELERYLQVLQSADGLYAASDEVDRDEFAHFFQAFDLAEHYPAFSGISYAQYISSAEEKEAYTNEVRADGSLNTVGYPDFTILPAGERPIYMPVTYIEPFNDKSTTFGYDLTQNPERFAATERARDTGFSIISSPVTLLGSSGARGFILVVPVYRNGMPTETVEERRAAFSGTINGIFTLDAFYNEAFREAENILPGISFVITDQLGTSAEANIYTYEDPKGRPKIPLFTENDIQVGGRIWKLEVYGNPDVIGSPVERNASSAILVLGLLSSFLVSLIVYRLGSEGRRAEELANLMTIRLRASEEQFNAILANSPTVMYLKDRQGKYLVVNAMFEELFKVRAADVTGKTDADLLPPEVAEVIRRNDQQVMEEKEARDFEEVLPVHGKPRTHLSIKFPLIAAGGSVYGVGGISTDISDRKQGEDELRQKSEELERLAASMVGREEKMIELKAKIKKYEGGNSSASL